ncbi:uncharacterized protein LOC115624070 [Scaptodrosophila lebanonensis]|uniref:Uncharacterized protein LOC115624070 n=1 Tax=Drosophila lebanonensis TaxID=7225 RepID=A0A6J2TCK1_DROLE|nr:uncharacterized protein LOC115624070 [Scaptodrosophila lebanonensis]
MFHLKLCVPFVFLLAITRVHCESATALPSSVAQYVVKDTPIIVQTPLQNYDQPTLKEYEECQSNVEECKRVCAEDNKCLDKCPICPELYNHPLVVQGVNDTGYLSSVDAVPPLNTTNIIRVTNEINNVIQNDLLVRNTNNVQVHQNTSDVGGRFGLGYNEHGSCCLVVRRTAEGHKRQRACGERCKARVMHARLVVQCDANQENCHESFEYVPARKRRQRVPPTLEYSYDGQQVVRSKRRTCQRCMELSYIYVVERGLPPRCQFCFQSYSVPLMPVFYAPQPLPMPYGYGGYGGHGVDTGYYPDYSNCAPQPAPEQGGNGWVLEAQKCQNEEGTLIDCFPQSEVEGDNNIVAAPAPAPGPGPGPAPAPAPAPEPYPKPEDTDVDDELAEYDFDNGYGVPAQRRRRDNPRQFIRSAYSRRNKN